jgi:ubiquinone/menaquinone biosynthesis C-methylase UbiE
VYLYFASDLTRAGCFDEASLAATTERHHVELAAPRLEVVADASVELSRSTVEGVVFELSSGLPSARHVRLIDQALRANRRAWLFWPAEQAIECVDDERLLSVRRHLINVKWLKRICQPVDNAVTRWHRVPTALRWIYRGEFPVRRSDIGSRLERLIAGAQPVPFKRPAESSRCWNSGVYVRTDYWKPASADDRMVRMIGQLASMTDRLVCLTTSRDGLLDGAGVHHVVMDAPRQTLGQDAIVLAPVHYVPIVKAACQAVAPSLLYDRLSAGQSVGAELSQSLQIPYIVEYLGSDAIIRDALNGATPVYAELYAKTEELALRQATVVVVQSGDLKEELISRGIDANRVLVSATGSDIGAKLSAIATAQAEGADRAAIQTGDSYKDRVQNQWNENPVGSHYVRQSQPRTLDWFLEVERHRYGVYAPWMPAVMEFAKHSGRDVLEIGGGLGTDLAQFARNGARVTDLDLAAGHLRLAEENFRLRGLSGRFIHRDAESLPFDDRSFDVVYSNGVLHHTPNTATVVGEIYRVLRPGGRAIIMLYAENSLHYWRKLVWRSGVRDGLLDQMSMGEIMSRQVERSANETRPLVKVYTKPRAARLFRNFECVEILQRQLQPQELPGGLKWTVSTAERLLGWNLIIKARKPQ